MNGQKWKQAGAACRLKIQDWEPDDGPPRPVAIKVCLDARLKEVGLPAAFNRPPRGPTARQASELPLRQVQPGRVCVCANGEKQI